ncbi:hypothetical protein X739_22305 [Mesorhizobium sp. LNHC220B00]|nr:hypothetical protein X739_22305 [Mesorhizobium sp. LNHC220B00]
MEASLLRAALSATIPGRRNPLNEIELAWALRVALAHELARTRVLIEELAQLQTEVRAASAIRYHARALPIDP